MQSQAWQQWKHQHKGGRGRGSETSISLHFISLVDYLNCRDLRQRQIQCREGNTERGADRRGRLTTQRTGSHGSTRTTNVITRVEWPCYRLMQDQVTTASTQEVLGVARALHSSGCGLGPSLSVWAHHTNQCLQSLWNLQSSALKAMRPQH